MDESPNILGISVDPAKNPDEDVLLDISDITKEDLKRQLRFQALISDLTEKFNYAERGRAATESIWITSQRMFRGDHSPEEKARIDKAKARNPYASEVFIKITKTKTLAAYGQILDILFAEDKFPIAVRPTKRPHGVAKVAHIAPEDAEEPDNAEAYGYPGDGKTIAPGETYKDLINGLYSKYKGFLKGKKVVEGPSPDPSMPTINPAEEAANNLENLLQDQFEEGGAENKLRQMALECVQYGTGIMKGPYTTDSTVHVWKLDEESKELTYQPEYITRPDMNFVSCWNFYPDPDAINCQDAGFVFERHLLNENKLRSLKRIANFDGRAIDRVLLTPPRAAAKYWEGIIKDNQVTQGIDTKQYEVFEYWGYLDKKMLEGFKNIDTKALEQFVDLAQVNVWYCNQEVIRLVLNPFVPTRIPYYAVPYEEVTGQIWGTGIPENMKDPQTLLNGHYRMAINNLSFAGNTILEVNENQLVPGQNMDLFPGKIFRKQGGAPGQSIYGITIPNVAPAHLQFVDKARQFADEVTGQPSYSYGQTGVTGVGKTASGISMLMSAASLNIKTVIKNFDHYLLTPIGEAYFFWNMQFNSKDVDVRGDVKIVAKGTSSLMQREVQSQRLLSFMQVAGGNPATAPFVNMEYIIKQFAKSMGLDPDQAVNDPTMAKLYAEIHGMMGQQPPGDPAQEATGGINPQDATGGGGGNIGVGSQPGPGDEQFSGPQQA